MGTHSFISKVRMSRSRGRLAGLVLIYLLFTALPPLIHYHPPLEHSHSVDAQRGDNDHNHHGYLHSHPLENPSTAIPGTSADTHENHVHSGDSDKSHHTRKHIPLFTKEKTRRRLTPKSDFTSANVSEFQVFYRNRLSTRTEPILLSLHLNKHDKRSTGLSPPSFLS